MTTNDVSDTRISTERLRHFIAYVDLMGPHSDLCVDAWEAKAMAIEILASRHPQPVNEPAEWQVEAFGRAFWGTYWIGTEEDKAQVRQALRAASIPAPERSKEETGVRVKPLEWEHSVIGDGTVLRQNSWRSGNYQIVESPAGNYDLRGHRYAICSTLEEATALAQADYEQRIRSAIDDT